MSELEKRQQEIRTECNDYLRSSNNIIPRDSATIRFLIKKIAELELKIDALENGKPVIIHLGTNDIGGTRIGEWPNKQFEENDF